MAEKAANAIVDRVAGFLRQHPPFDLLKEEPLYALSAACKIQYAAANDWIFEEGEACGREVFVVRSGLLEIATQADGVLELCDAGDVVGARSLVDGTHYRASARMREGGVLYRLPSTALRELMEADGQFAWFFLEGLAAGRYRDPQQAGRAMDPQLLLRKLDFNQLRPAPGIAANTLIQEAAKEMSALNHSAILVWDRHQHPKGIVTDRDLRRKVATGLYALDLPVSEIMSFPVRCAPPHLAEAEYQSILLEAGFRHLVITQDGTDRSPALHILSEHDLLVQQSDNPAVLLRHLRQLHLEELPQWSDKVQQWSERQLNTGLPASLISRYSGILHDALVRKIIALWIEQLGSAPVGFAWLELGSYARYEQVLRTDQDHALVYESGGDEVRKWFLQLARKLSETLEKCGFEQDPAGIGAHHPDWCLSLAEWKNQCQRWIAVPDPKNILLSTIFFDFRMVEGDAELVEDLRKSIQATNKDLYLRWLANDALRTPAPMGFFQRFVLEKDGTHKDAFDLKLRALLPLVDLARLLAIDFQIADRSSRDRFHAIAQQWPEQSKRMQLAVSALDTLLHLRFEAGFRNHNSGRYVPIQQINKLQRQQLRNIFQLIEELQRMVKLRYQTDLLR